MSVEELAELEKAAASSKFSRELLRFVRKENLRDPQLVLRHGGPIAAGSSKDDEFWTVNEQVLIAALDAGDYNTADECLFTLLKKFPKSARVRRLQGMRREASGDFDGARAVYVPILKENPANVLVSKRYVAIKLAEGDTTGAVASLNAYLEGNCGDAEAWTELANIHINLGNFEEAAFCYEELVLLLPAQPHHHSRLAEIYYTLGGADGLRRARKHFAQSAELAHTNPRALHGLCMTCAAMAVDKGCAKIIKAEQQGEVNAALQKWAAAELAKLYKQSSQSVLKPWQAVAEEQAAMVQKGITSEQE